MAKIAQDCGVKMITVHGRTRCQLYNGAADWRAVRAVKDAVDLPVIVNGDILGVTSAREALAQSGADGVMVGRGSYGKPWVIRQIIDALYNRTESAAPSHVEKCAVVLEHYDALLRHYGTHQGVPVARKHIGWYCKDMDGSNELRGEINALGDPAQVVRRVEEFFARAA